MLEENKNIEEQIDETVEEMWKKIEEISQNADKVEGDFASKAQEIKTKAVDVLNNVVVKLKGLYNNVNDNEDVKKTLAFVKSKAKDLYDSALKSINDFMNQEKVKDSLSNANEFASKVVDKVSDVYNDAVEAAKKNETIKNISEKVSAGYENVVKSTKEFLEKPEVQDRIDKVKDGTIDIAEKAVEALRNWLRPEDKKEEDKQEPKE